MRTSVLLGVLIITTAAILIAVFLALPRGAETMWALAGVVTAMATLIGVILNNRSPD